jgi:hypothetical protein
MATAKNAKPIARSSANNRGSNDSYYIPPPPVSSNTPNENSEMGFLIAFLSMVVVFGILLPIMGAMYLDILEAKQETKRQQEQVQRLINQAKEKNDSNSRIPP